jgi:hypothetical protein
VQLRPRRSIPPMGRLCTICKHPRREEIEKAILDSAAGYRSVAARFGISAPAVFRHRREHLPQTVAKGFSLAVEAAALVASAPSPSRASKRTAPRTVIPPSLERAVEGFSPAQSPGPLPISPPASSSPEGQHAIRIAEHVAASEERRDRHAIDVVQQLRAINAACLEVLREARSNHQPLMLLRAVDRIARQIELQAKLLGQIQEGPTVNVAILPEWHGLRQVVLVALSPFPDARLAVANALRQSGC